MKSTINCDGSQTTSRHNESGITALKCFGSSEHFIRNQVYRRSRLNVMSEEEFAEADKGKKKKKSDYAEVEFEIGNIEFEAKGRSVVVERMFRLLLEKIETGKLVAEFKLQDLEEEEDEEEEEKEESKVEKEELPAPAEEIFEEAPVTPEPSLDPPPAWDTLDEKEPEVSEAEREELGL